MVRLFRLKQRAPIFGELKGCLGVRGSFLCQRYLLALGRIRQIS
jgi:hypothetical protein